MAMTERRSAVGFSETLGRVLAAIDRRGLTVFATIDHAAGAREAGMELDDETVILLGNPQGGTPLMQADPRIGIELPLRLLVWRRSDAVFVGHLNMAEEARDYDVGRESGRLVAMTALLDEIAAEATAET
jgi:uncharacterized protein (DUF302 family)